MVHGLRGHLGLNVLRPAVWPLKQDIERAEIPLQLMVAEFALVKTEMNFIVPPILHALHKFLRQEMVNGAIGRLGESVLRPAAEVSLFLK